MTEMPPPMMPDEGLLAPPEEYIYEERQRVSTPAEEQAALGEEITELTDEERLWFSTLMTVGRRSKVIEVMGHTVCIQNLNSDDDLRIGLWCKQYQGAPPADSRAYHLGVCAAGIRTIDGLPLYQSLFDEAEGDDELFQGKIEKLRKFYPVVVTQIYHAILELDAEFAQLAKKLGKLPG